MESTNMIPTLLMLLLINLNPHFHYSFINTVKSNLRLYTHREIRNAGKTRMLYRYYPFISPQRFISLLDINYFLNSGYTKRAGNTRGTDVVYLQDKTTKKHHVCVPGISSNPVP